MKNYKELNELEKVLAIEEAKKEIQDLIEDKNFKFENVTETQLLEMAEEMAESAWYNSPLETIQDCAG